MCGLPPFVDELIDVFIDEGMIFVGVPRLFTRPLRLNSVEAFELLAAARAAMELPGADPDGALGRGLAKLADGARRGRHRRCPGRARAPRARRSSGDGGDRRIEQLLIEYSSAARDETTESADRPASGVRRPGRVVRQRRRRALGGGAHVPDRPDRLGRADRAIVDAELRCRCRCPAPGSPMPRCRRAVCGCRRPRSGWSSAFRSTPSSGPDADGWSTVTLPVASEQWLVRTLLRLGPEASLLEPAELASRRCRRPPTACWRATGARRTDRGRRRRTTWLAASRWWSTPAVARASWSASCGRALATS